MRDGHHAELADELWDREVDARDAGYVGPNDAGEQCDGADALGGHG
jgi:hypothetical protein